MCECLWDFLVCHANPSNEYCASENQIFIWCTYTYVFGLLFAFVKYVSFCSFTHNSVIFLSLVNTQHVSDKNDEYLSSSSPKTWDVNENYRQCQSHASFIHIRAAFACLLTHSLIRHMCVYCMNIAADHRRDGIWKWNRKLRIGHKTENRVEQKKTSAEWSFAHFVNSPEWICHIQFCVVVFFCFKQNCGV